VLELADRLGSLDMCHLDLERDMIRATMRSPSYILTLSTADLMPLTPSELMSVILGMDTVA
jgi:hypothetical protein